MKALSLLVLLACAITAWAASSASFSANLQGPTTPVDRFWKRSVGSGHAALALREDWRQYMRMAARDIGFERVRFHAIFDDDMSVVLPGPTDGSIIYSWYNVDSVYDFLLSIGVRPLVELSFMPELLAKNPEATVFHYKGVTSLPADPSEWASLIEAFATHLLERYGAEEVYTWEFEVWNEWNCGFLNGTQQDYYDLYAVTAWALKSVDANLRVGGPATCGSGYLPEFLAFTTQHNVPVDFVSTHEYPTDIGVWDRDAMLKAVSGARAQVPSNLPLLYTEFNDGLYFTPTFHDTSFAAAFIAKNAGQLQGQLNLASWWTVSDIFEEQGFQSTPFGDSCGWGLINRNGIPKPSFRAFELLNLAGPNLVALTASSSQVSQTVDAWATVESTQAGRTIFTAFITNIDDPTQKWTVDPTETCFTVQGVPSSQHTPVAVLFAINPSAPNPAQQWNNMGSPVYMKQAQIDQLVFNSTVPRSSVPLTANADGSYSFCVSVPLMSFYTVVIEF